MISWAEARQEFSFPRVLYENLHNNNNYYSRQQLSTKSAEHEVPTAYVYNATTIVAQNVVFAHV